MNLLEAVVEEMCFLGMPYVRPLAVLDLCDGDRRRRRRLLNEVLDPEARRKKRCLRRIGLGKFWCLPVAVSRLIEMLASESIPTARAEAFLAWKPVVRGPGQAEKQRSMRYWTCNALVKLAGNGQEWVTVAQVHEECVSEWKNLVWVGKIIQEFTNGRTMLRKGGKRAFWYRIDLEKLEKWYKNEYGM